MPARGLASEAVPVPIIHGMIPPRMPDYPPELQVKPHPCIQWGPGFVKYKDPNYPDKMSSGCYICDLDRLTVRKIDRIGRHMIERHFNALKTHWLKTEDALKEFKLTIPQFICSKEDCSHLSFFRIDEFKTHCITHHSMERFEASCEAKKCYYPEGRYGSRDQNANHHGKIVKSEPEEIEVHSDDWEGEQAKPPDRHIEEDYDGEAEKEGDARHGDAMEVECPRVGRPASSTKVTVTPASMGYVGGMSGAFRFRTPTSYRQYSPATPTSGIRSSLSPSRDTHCFHASAIDVPSSDSDDSDDDDDMGIPSDAGEATGEGADADADAHADAEGEGETDDAMSVTDANTTMSHQHTLDHTVQASDIAPTLVRSGASLDVLMAQQTSSATSVMSGATASERSSSPEMLLSATTRAPSRPPSDTPPKVRSSPRSASVPRTTTSSAPHLRGTSRKRPADTPVSHNAPPQQRLRRQRQIQVHRIITETYFVDDELEPATAPAYIDTFQTITIPTQHATTMHTHNANPEEFLETMHPGLISNRQASAATHYPQSTMLGPIPMARSTSAPAPSFQSPVTVNGVPLGYMPATPWQPQIRYVPHPRPPPAAAPHPPADARKSNNAYPRPPDRC